ncbi:MAG: hypothetical protein HKP58_00260 [Desulfatitalea sp.]|nr:hypothetical protein [Desulfatitalea sp.]NNJ98822.1 hypothetical protein [Desulfatitalea sp.]
MKIIETIALISINETLIIQLLSFLLFAFIFHRIMVRPLRRVMDDRDVYLKRIENDIVAAEEEYKQIHRRAVEQEAAARAAAFKIRDELETAGQMSAQTMIVDAKTRIRQMQNDARDEAARQLTAAREQIRMEAEAVAERMMSVLLPKGAQGSKVGN